MPPAQGLCTSRRGLPSSNYFQVSLSVAVPVAGVVERRLVPLSQTTFPLHDRAQSTSASSRPKGAAVSTATCREARPVLRWGTSTHDTCPT